MALEVRCTNNKYIHGISFMYKIDKNHEKVWILVMYDVPGMCVMHYYKFYNRYVHTFYRSSIRRLSESRLEGVYSIEFNIMTKSCFFQSSDSCKTFNWRIRQALPVRHTWRNYSQLITHMT